MANALVQVRIDEELKDRATAIYDALGIDLSTAIRMFLKRSVMVNGIPLPKWYAITTLYMASLLA